MSQPTSSIVSDDQAGSLGGADKKTGAHGKDTHQVSNERNIVVIVRFKPKESVFTETGMQSASSLIGSVTGAVASATGAVEDAMNSIPGLQMFIKEDKTNSSSEKEYKYDYTEWDSKIPTINRNLQKIFPDNKVLEVFEFHADDADGRKQAAKGWFDDKLRSAMSGFNSYKVRLHLVGIGQGGNVVNELTDLIAKDSKFRSEDWLVKSVFYVGTPAYTDLHKLNEACMKSQGAVFNFGCSLDLTQQLTDHFVPSDEFLKFIINSNSNTMSLAVGKIKLTIVKILSLFLSNSSIGFGQTHGLDKFGEIKPEIENLVKQMTGMIKQVASEITSFIDPGKLPDFSEALNGLDQVPDKSVKRASNFISDVGDTLKSQARNIFTGGGGVGPQDLMGIFNCLCPVFDQVAKCISVFDYESKATIGLANQMIENAGITDLYKKGESEGSSVELSKVATQYFQERVKNYQETGVVDKITKLVGDASAILVDLDSPKVTVKNLSDEKKIQLAGALYSIIQPMLLSKKRVLEELQKWIQKLDIGTLLKDVTANNLVGMTNPLLSKLNLDFQQPLKDSINGVDGQLDRLKGFFGPREYDLHKDTLYYIFNIHNVVINSFFDDIQYQLDNQTGFIEYMSNRGCENQFSLSGKNTYNPATEKNPEDTLVTNKVPETANS